MVENKTKEKKKKKKKQKTNAFSSQQSDSSMMICEVRNKTKEELWMEKQNDGRRQETDEKRRSKKYTKYI